MASALTSENVESRNVRTKFRLDARKLSRGVEPENGPNVPGAPEKIDRPRFMGLVRIMSGTYESDVHSPESASDVIKSLPKDARRWDSDATAWKVTNDWIDLLTANLRDDGYSVRTVRPDGTSDPVQLPITGAIKGPCYDVAKVCRRTPAPEVPQERPGVEAIRLMFQRLRAERVVARWLLSRRVAPTAKDPCGSWPSPRRNPTTASTNVPHPNEKRPGERLRGRSATTPGRDDPMNTNTESHNLLTPSEVAEMFAVDPKTVTRWAKRGLVSSIRTLGGHRRYHRAEIEALLNR